MSSESFAAFRRHRGEDLRKLAEEHMKHDLQQSDRDKLHAASKSFGTWAAVGSAVGLGLGVLLAYRVRANRARWFNTFRAIDKPTHVQFADGRIQPIPDVTPLLKPSTLGDVATYTFFAAGGVFVFGELGLLAGSMSAMSTITSDPASGKRIEHAYKRFRADVLRKEAERLEESTSSSSSSEFVW